MHIGSLSLLIDYLFDSLQLVSSLSSLVNPEWDPYEAYVDLLLLLRKSIWLFSNSEYLIWASGLVKKVWLIGENWVFFDEHHLDEELKWIGVLKEYFCYEGDFN